MSYMMILAGNCMDEKKWNFNSLQGSLRGPFLLSWLSKKCGRATMGNILYNGINGYLLEYTPRYMNNLLCTELLSSMIYLS